MPNLHSNGRSESDLHPTVGVRTQLRELDGVISGKLPPPLEVDHRLQGIGRGDNDLSYL